MVSLRKSKVMYAIQLSSIPLPLNEVRRFSPYRYASGRQRTVAFHFHGCLGVPIYRYKPNWLVIGLLTLEITKRTSSNDTMESEHLR